MPRKASLKGFTLLELLVVVIIIGIASSIILLKSSSFFYSNRRAEFLAKEFATLIDLARKQAVFSMSVLALQINPNDYVFLRLDDSDGLSWKPLGANDPFWATRKIPDNIIINVSSDSALQKAYFSSNNLNPQIIILPSGEITPFKIAIHKLNNATTYVVSASYAGGIKIDVTK